jgi:hemoglobin
MSAAMHASIGRAALAELVDRFYDRVRRDPLLGPVFESAIPAQEWEAHKARLLAFWCSAMLGTREFRGNVMARHRVLDGITPQHFARWLTLFEDSAAGLFAPAEAARLAHAARGLAHGMQIGLFGRAQACA